MSDVSLRVKSVMSKVFNIPAEQINENSSPESIEGWDSLSHLTLVVSLEEEFNLEFTDEQMMDMMDFKSIVNLLTKK
jgi:acyl carrier protein